MNVPDLIEAMRNLEDKRLQFCSWDLLYSLEYELAVLKAKIDRRKAPTLVGHKCVLERYSDSILLALPRLLDQINTKTQTEE